MVWCIVSSVLYFTGSTRMCFILIYIIIGFKVINVKNDKIEKIFLKKIFLKKRQLDLSFSCFFIFFVLVKLYYLQFSETVV